MQKPVFHLAGKEAREAAIHGAVMTMMTMTMTMTMTTMVMMVKMLVYQCVLMQNKSSVRVVKQ